MGRRTADARKEATASARQEERRQAKEKPHSLLSENWARALLLDVEEDIIEVAGAIGSRAQRGARP